MRRKFHTLDVFTQDKLAGNPLAVVHDAQDLSDETMLAIAREFNLPETVFVVEPRNPINTARLRIFTPGRELPFAGHPTVGTAALLAQMRAPELLRKQDLSLVLEEQVGDVQCIARWVEGQGARASFVLPKPAHAVDWQPDLAAIADALRLDPTEIGFDAHRPAAYSAGVPYCYVPIQSRAALNALRPRTDALAQAFPHSVFLYSNDAAKPGSAYHARMFGFDLGIAEDPATGSAVAAFSGLLHDFDRPCDGDHTLVIEQGFAMGRPSFITLGLEIEAGALRSASIGGGAVIVQQGVFDL